MKSFCTVVTASHIPFAFAAFESVKKFIPDVVFEVLVVDSFPQEGLGEEENFNLIGLSALSESEIAQSIYDKYYHKHMDAYRWSMKSVLVNYLLELQYDQVIYIDSDIYFYEDPSFLFDKLDEQNILLTPHWRTKNPADNFRDFVRNNTHGLFNGGFVACNKAGKESMLWWAKACEYSCVVNSSKGLFVDQSYFNLFPIYFDKVEIVKHRGCNIANWNIRENKRKNVGDKVLINDEFPIIFIHLTSDTMKGVYNGEDPLLKPYFEQYAEHVNNIEPTIDLIKKYSNAKKRFGLF